MHHLWERIRIPFAIVVLLIITLAMARLFSGPEDTWIKNEYGEWIKHGHPSGPPPMNDYQEPIYHIIVPLIFLISFIVPLFFIGKYKPHNRLNFDTITRDIKFLGYISTSLLLLGILVGAALIIEIGLNATRNIPETIDVYKSFLLIISLMGFSLICIFLGFLLFVLKRNCNDHYQLERSRSEIIEILENLRTNK
jgi:hypothetical protein